MGKPFTVNTSRFNPYSTWRFLIFFGTSTTPVAGVSKVSGLKRSSPPIEYKSGGDPITRKSLGRTVYDAITVERGVTYDADFETWANAAQLLDKGAASQSLKSLRKDVAISLMDETGQEVMRWRVWRCWVSEFQAISDFDAGGNAVAIQHIKLENEGWERDLTVTEQPEV